MNCLILVKASLFFPRSSLSQIMLCDGVKSRAGFSLQPFLVKLNFQRVNRKWFYWSASAFLAIVFEPSAYLLLNFLVDT